MTVMDHSTNLTHLPGAPADLATAKLRFASGDYNKFWSDTRRLKIQGSVNKAIKVYNALDIATVEELMVVSREMV